MIAFCRRCSQGYEPSPYEARKRDFMCRPCRRQRGFEYRAKRKAEGRPSRSGQPSKEYYREWAARPENRQKNATRARTRTAIKSGRLVPQPCEVCAALPVEAHHDDYSDHLAVRWLCKTHHEAHHRQATGAA